MLEAMKNPFSGLLSSKLESFVCHLNSLQLYLVHIY